MIPLFLLILAFIAGSALAADFDEAVAAVEKRDYSTALRIFQKLAKQGNIDAERNLGLMHWRGMAKRK